MTEKPGDQRTGLDAVRQVIADAKPRQRKVVRAEDGVKEIPLATALPEDCPVTVLGYDEGGANWFLNEVGLLVAIAEDKMSRLPLMGLFRHHVNYLTIHWPKLTKAGLRDGFMPERVAASLLQACANKGVIKPDRDIRGPGAWADEDGNLIFHCGDKIALVERGKLATRNPDRHGRHIYPRGAAGPKPWEDALKPGDATVLKLVQALGTWKWRRGELDAVLMLGWIGAAMIGGALAWRPAVWVTGGSGTGKSTLHELLKLLFDDGLISVSDTTAAGVWQKLEHSTLPVAIDELEATADNRRAQAVIEVMRQACSGGLILRGGAAHKGAEFRARSSFLFSSVLLPPLLPQDRNRIAILELMKLPARSEPPALGAAMLREWGAKLRRRLMDLWALLPARLALYRAELADRGNTPRFCDQYGTLMAVADLLLYGEEDPAERDGDTIKARCDALDAASRFDLADEEDDQASMLRHLLNLVVTVIRMGEKGPVSELMSIGELAEIARKPSHDLLEGEPEGFAQKALMRRGLKIHQEGGDTWLAIANRHPELAKLFAGTQWAARPGASAPWAQAASRLPGAARSADGIWFAGGTSRATLVPVSLLRGQ